MTVTGGTNVLRGFGYSQLDKTSHQFVTNKNSIAHCYNGATDEGTIIANQATYLGTIYATANGQTGMAFSASAAGGGANVLGVYNAYNRIAITAFGQDSTASWAYGTNTWRKADNSAGNSVTYVDGLAQSNVDMSYTVLTSLVTANAELGIGVQCDWSSGSPTFTGYNIAGAGGGTFNENQLFVKGACLPSMGLHVSNALEVAAGASNSFFTTTNSSNIGFLFTKLDM
jgi:hypothetical protein